MENLTKDLEMARTLYLQAVKDYNAHVASLLTDDPSDEALYKTELLLKRCEIMQEYFNNIKDARNTLLEDE